MEEIWKDIPGYNGHYQASSLGRIRSFFNLGRNLKSRVSDSAVRIMSPATGKFGYRYLSLYIAPMTKKGNLVHSLIAETFLGPRPTGYDIRHIDGNKANNAASNLAYGTRIENEADKLLHGTSNRGGRNGMAKMTERTVILARQMKKAGYGLIAIAATFGLKPGGMRAILNGQNWKHLPL